MLEQDEHASELFDRLSPPIARALSAHLGVTCARPTTLRSRAAAELRLLCGALHGLSRRELLEVARLRFSLVRPDWTARLHAAPNEEVMLRLYLESEECFRQAHRPLLVGPGVLSVFRAEYTGYVVPSQARIERMRKALVQTQLALGLGCAATSVFVDDHQMSMQMGSGGPAQLAFSFFFERAALCVRAASYFERARVRSAFATIFAEDEAYFRTAGQVAETHVASRWPTTA